MPKIFQTLDKVKPVYDAAYKFVLFVCKLLLTADIVITSVCVVGRYVSFVPDPAWSEEVVLTLMSYMAVLSAALAIRRNAHIRMTAFDAYLQKNAIKVLDILADVAVFILAIVMITVGFSYATGIEPRVITSACRGCPSFGCISRFRLPELRWSFLNWKQFIITLRVFL